MKYCIAIAFTLITLMLFNSCKKEQHKDPTDPTYISSVYFGDDIAVHSVKEGFTLLKVSSYQQTTEYTCGPAAVLSMMKFYNRTGDEMSIAGEMGTSTTTGTTPGQMTDWLNTHGFHATWQEHGTLEMLRENLAKNKPTLVEWSDWGGHWVLVIGYDTRNTEDLMDDVIIFADPYDRHDDHKDGVTWFNAQRFYYMWYDALLFGSVMRNVYIQAEPI